MNLFTDKRNRSGVFFIKNGSTDELASVFFQFQDLGDGAFDILGRHIGHRLQNAFVLAADLQAADINRSGFGTFYHSVNTSSIIIS